MGKFGQVCLVLALMTAALAAQEWGGPESVGVEVRDPKGRPVNEAKIMLTYAGQSGGVGPPLVATDSKGKAVVADLVLGQWQIEISHPDYLSYVGILHLRPGKKAAISTSFLEATGTSLTPVKVKFFNARSAPASQPLPDQRPDLPQLAAAPAAPPATVEEEIAAEVIAEAPQPVVSADQPPSTVTPPVGSYAQSDDESASTVTPAIDTPVVRSEPPPTEPVVAASPETASPATASPVIASPVTSPVTSPVAESPTEDSPKIEAPAAPEPSPMPVAPPETVPSPEPIEERVEEPVVVEVSEPVEASPPPLPSVAVPEIAGEPASELDSVDETVEPPVSEPPVSEPPVSEPPVSEPPVAEPLVSQPSAEEQQSEASLPEELPEVVTEAPVPEPEIESTPAIEPEPEPQIEPQVEPQIEPQVEPQVEPVAPIPAETEHQEEPIQAEVQETLQAPPPTQPIEQPTSQPVEPIEPAETPTETPISPPVTPTPDETVTEPPAEVPPTDVIPAPAAGVVGVGSYRDGSCPDCQTGEWAAASSKIVGANLTGSRCDQQLTDATRSAMQGLGDSINLELAGYLGPVFSDTGRSASQLAEQDLAEPLRGRLGPHLDGSSACQIVALVVPKAVRYTKTRYFAADRDGSRECAVGTDCGIGSSKWATSAQVEKGHSATVVWALFENTASGRDRRATLAVYFRPPNAGWHPRTLGGQ